MVHTLLFFDSAEVWMLQKLSRSLKCRYGLTFHIPLLKLFLEGFIYLYPGFGLLVSADVFHRFFVSRRLAFLPCCG